MSHPTTLDVAAEARSVLARPAEISLTVGDTEVHLDHRDGILDVAGEPSIAVPADSPLAERAAQGAAAQLRIRSGLDGPDAPARRQTLTLSGRMECVGVQDCRCCDRTRQLIALRTDFVLLTIWPQSTNPEWFPGKPVRVPLAAYRSPAHDLNRGYLQTMADHTTGRHHEELCARVEALTGRTPIAVSVEQLSTDGLRLDWVDPHGGNRRRLDFDRPARTRTELTTSLTELLGLSLC